jgi:catechol 2,3-dioxygenase-like lactoylglutathione lyase family enzyme
MAAHLIGAAHLVPVGDLATSAAFYRDMLGFRELIRAEAHGYVMMRREGMMVGLQGNATPETVAITSQHLAVQVWVDDLDALWAELGPGLETLPEGRLRRPFRQPYGVREFHVKDPDGFLMLFSDAGDADVTDWRR